MQIDSYSNLRIHLIILILLVFLNVITTFFRRKRNKARSDKEKTRLKERYPNLSDKDFKYRKQCITNYSKIYFNGYSNFNLVVFFTILFLVTIGVLIGLMLSNNLYGVYICVALLFFYLSAIALSTPKPDKEHAFWRNYLETHPDNPLMIVLCPIEQTNKLVRSVRLAGIFHLICGLDALFIAYMIFSLYY